MKKYLFILAALLAAVLSYGQPTPAQGVGRIIAGTNVTISPTSGTGGAVTINAAGGSGSPGGSSGDIQYNNAGSFGGITPGTGVVTALGVNIGSAGAPVLFNGALGTPSSGTVTNLTGTASININGTVGATTPAAGTFTTGVFGSTTSLLLGTAGSAVGNIGFRNATSGTATLAPPTGALGTYSVTLPNAASTLPIYPQQITYTGPSAARTVTYPDANFTAARTDAANTFTGVQSMTSPAFTTSATTPSTTFALLNTTATTINAFGAATTVNTGASATQIWNFGGSTSASEFRYLEPSGSGTNYSAFKAQAQGANITYTLPSTVGAAGEVLSDPAGNGTLDWVAAGTGTVTVVGAGSLTSTALVTGGGTTTLQTPSATATMDSSGNISTPGTVTVGSGASTAGALSLKQGTTQSTGTTNITVQAPTSVTSHIYTLPGTVGTNGAFWTQTTSGATATLLNTKVVPSGTVVGTSDTQTLTDKRITARITTVTSNATPTCNTDITDILTITAQAAAITSMTTNLSGTPLNGDQLEVRIKDDGTPRAITWGASFVAGPVALPTTTVTSKALRNYFEYDTVRTAWVLMYTGSDI
jgi:hypothetical protein